jgi:hypothetical protein
MRLRTEAPIPPPSAFLFKNQLAALKGPYKIHIIANMLVQQVLGFGMISWIQGFSDLRAISLCIVDAILTAPILVGIMNLVLFMQIGATGLLIARFILERRIAINGGGRGDAEKSVKRSDTMQTFGFDTAPPASDRPPLVERRTVDLLGKEDTQIGWPLDARKLGDQDSLLRNSAQPASSNPLLEPRQQQGDFEGTERFLFPQHKPSEIAPSYPRPSSEYGPQNLFISDPPPRTGTQDLGDGSPGPTLIRKGD